MGLKLSISPCCEYLLFFDIIDRSVIFFLYMKQNKNPAAVLLGQLAAQKNLKKPKKYWLELSKKGVEARQKKVVDKVS